MRTPNVNTFSLGFVNAQSFWQQYLRNINAGFMPNNPDSPPGLFIFLTSFFCICIVLALKKSPSPMTELRPFHCQKCTKMFSSCAALEVLTTKIPTMKFLATPTST